jgi:FkbM family methyltransferase
MRTITKKLVRTLQVYFPSLQDTVYSLRRLLRTARKKPFEDDFQALRLFPDDGESQIFLDVGANRGQSIDAIRIYRKDSQIIAFEPNEFLYRKLVELYKYDKKTLIHNVGLGDSVGEFTLYIPFYKKWMFDGLGSLRKKEAEDLLSGMDQIYFYDHQFLSLEETTVRVTTLDELELSPFFIKIDTQGYELMALRGAKKTLTTSEPVLLIEWPEDEVVDFLTSLDYQFYRFEKSYFIPGVRGPLNTFFMTRNKSDFVRKYIQPHNG